MGGFFILRPFMTAIMWSVILGFSLWPAQRLLTRWLRGRKTLAAIFVAIIVSLLLVGPIVLLGFGIADDASSLGKATKKWVESASDEPPAWTNKVPLVGDEVADSWRQIMLARRGWLARIDKGMNEAPRARVVSADGEVIEDHRISSRIHPNAAIADDLAATEVIEEGKVFEWSFKSL